MKSLKAFFRSPRRRPLRSESSFRRGRLNSGRCLGRAVTYIFYEGLQALAQNVVCQERIIRKLKYVKFPDIVRWHYCRPHEMATTHRRSQRPIHRVEHTYAVLCIIHNAATHNPHSTAHPPSHRHPPSHKTSIVPKRHRKAIPPTLATTLIEKPLSHAVQTACSGQVRSWVPRAR